MSLDNHKSRIFQITLGGIVALILLVIAITFGGDSSSLNLETISIENIPTTSLDESGLQSLLNKAIGADYVLLGESSHGTHEYYYWRKIITQELVQHHGYSYVVVEGDWASLCRVNQYVKHLSNEFDSGKEILATFNRWPQWMWANEEFLELVEWLRDYNQDRSLESRIGVYGKDVYGIEESAEALITFLDNANSNYLMQTKDAYNCLLAYNGDYEEYLHDVFYQGLSCHENIKRVVEYLASNASTYQAKTSKKAFLNAKQNALVVQNGEEYYRLSVTQGNDSWNSRVMHMKQTINRLGDYYQQRGKGIVWAHNTHVGDARATEMASSGMWNIGQLLREKYGHEKVFIVGFGTYEGEVVAGSEWGSPMQVMKMPPARTGSLEDLLSKAELDSFILFLDEPLPPALKKPLGHRAKGVVYQPNLDARQYVTTVLPERYDAFIYFDKTSALTSI